MTSKPAMDLKRKDRSLISSQNLAEDTIQQRKRQKLRSSSPVQSSFLTRLPCEIRCEIYQLVLQSSFKSAQKPTLLLAIANRGKRALKTALAAEGEDLSWFWTRQITIGLLQVSRQVRLEALDVLYKETKFDLTKLIYKPEDVKTIISPLKPQLFRSIRHIRLRIDLAPNELRCDEKTTTFNACCSKWKEYLPALDHVGVLIQFTTPFSEIYRTENDIAKAAAFIAKLMAPFTDVEKVFLIAKNKKTLTDVEKAYHVPSRAEKSEKPDSDAFRVLHIATETLRIKRLMAIKRHSLKDVMMQAVDSDTTIPYPLLQLPASSSGSR